MECHNCEKEFDDKDGMMYVERDVEEAGRFGARYIWLCNGCMPLFDFISRDKIWLKVHGFKLSKRIDKKQHDIINSMKVKYDICSGEKLGILKRIKNICIR